ncbi:MFS transporter [Prauserella alba]|uniref:Major Facilitator Superfamily protein n=1 Tax=Prauserella alba TaxID=176898 RepID=A0ABP4G6X8_9PSEU|nr:MFS transporter [Prauserella alba]MCP2180933.1 putative arabinose efflux permease, MFS family [Prauserella alba]
MTQRAASQRDEGRRQPTRDRRSARGNELAAGLARGPVEVLDFVLPLWAGSVLGLSPSAIGVLTATETLVSLLARPVAGALADRADRGRVAAAGALLYALSFAGYAVAGGQTMAMAAAVVGGIGGALFWVALRARVAEGLTDDSGAFAKLFAAEGTGTWIAFVVALTAVSQIDYAGVFWLGAAASAGAAVVLAGGGPSRGSAREPVPAFRALGRRLWPLLGVVALTALAETGVALLLMLHLQRGHDLDIGAIAAVFLPGFIVYSTIPEYLHGVVTRLGRTTVVSVALGCSAVFAGTLAFAPNPWVIAGAWILAAAAFAAAIPVEQAAVAEAAGVSLGRGMAVYESAVLLGATAGAASAGALYEIDGGWQLACGFAAGVLAVAAVLMRIALRKVGVTDRPAPTPGTADPATTPEQGATEDSQSAAGADTAASTPAGSTTAAAAASTSAVLPQQPRDPDEGTESGAESGTVPHSETETVMTDAETTRNREKASPLQAWGVHAAVYVVAQIALGIAGYSWPVETVLGWPHEAEYFWNSSGHWLLNAGRIWTFIFVLDTVWSVGRALLSRRSR